MGYAIVFPERVITSTLLTCESVTVAVTFSILSHFVIILIPSYFIIRRGAVVVRALTECIVVFYRLLIEYLDSVVVDHR